MVILLMIAMILRAGSGDGGPVVNNVLFSDLLQAHVRDGVVDYGKMKADPRLGPYLAGLATADPGSIKDTHERLAFWINLYNATTLKLICDHHPVESISDLHTGGLIIGTVIKATAWDRKIVKVKGQVLTLNEVEHSIIRPQFGDPRAHFALVCASKSCPPLRNEAFDGGRLEEQLDDQARVFLVDPLRNEFDPVTRTAKISKIFSWYDQDFGGSEMEILMWLADYLSGPARISIVADPSAWEVEYKDYDWSLNGY
jgi:hypothetical protein